MTRRQTAAYTLIELLIVIAIIAIICGSSMAVITAPMFERVRAEDQESFETGAGTAFASIVYDAHRAASIESSTSGTVVFSLAAPTTGTVTYSLNSSGTLTRTTANEQPVNLIPQVQSFYVEKESTGTMATVHLQGKLRGYRGEATLMERKMDFNIGASAWMGGGV